MKAINVKKIKMEEMQLDGSLHNILYEKYFYLKKLKKNYIFKAWKDEYIRSTWNDKHTKTLLSLTTLIQNIGLQ